MWGKSKKKILFFNILVLPNILFAQVEDQIEPPPATPIDEYLYLAFTFSILLAVVYFLKFVNKIENK